MENWVNKIINALHDRCWFFQSNLQVNSLYVILFLIGSSLMGCGEKYSEQGKVLSTAISHELINRGMCANNSDCFNLLPMYGEDGDRVHINFYNVGPINKKALVIAIELVISRGIEITHGVPISIQAFPKPHDEYINFKNFFQKIQLLN